jgi:xanthine/CO dehydrogenase XdhC/CoxF family maturation factor
MLVSHAGRVAGCVSGGCLEDDILRKAFWRTERGPMLVSYDSSVPPGADRDEMRAAYGLGCGGLVDVLLERGDAAQPLDPLALAARCTQRQQRAAVATVFRSEVATIPVGARIALIGGDIEDDGLAFPPAVRDEVVNALYAVLERGRSASLAVVAPGGAFDVLIEALRPPVRLFVFGSGHDVVPLVQLARMIGWDVVLCARRPRNAMLDGIAMADEVIVAAPSEVAGRIEGADHAFAVVMNHSIDDDRECLSMLLRSPIGYIGVLGPRTRTYRLLAGLGGVENDSRLHAPIGLELGAETPAEIALSIIGEIQSALSRTPATRLRDRRRPIHDPRESAWLPPRVVTG